MSRTKVPRKELERIVQWLQEEQEHRDTEGGKSAVHQNTLRTLAVVSLIAAIAGALSFALPGLDLTQIPTASDMGMALRGMVICFSIGIVLMAGHAWFHYVAVEEELKQLDQSQVLESIIKESEIGSNRAKGFIAYAGMLRTFSFAFVLLGFGLAARILLRILLGY